MEPLTLRKSCWGLMKNSRWMPIVLLKLKVISIIFHTMNIELSMKYCPFSMSTQRDKEDIFCCTESYLAARLSKAALFFLIHFLNSVLCSTDDRQIPKLNQRQLLFWNKDLKNIFFPLYYLIADLWKTNLQNKKAK